MSRTQTLRPTKSEAIFIATPVGLIKLSPGPKKQWVIELPGSLRAFKSSDRAISNSAFLKQGDDGRLEPAYRMLLPVCDSAGALMDVSGANGPLHIGKVAGK